MQEDELKALIAEAREAFASDTHYAIDIANGAQEIYEWRSLLERFGEVQHLGRFDQMKALGITRDIRNKLSNDWNMSQRTDRIEEAIRIS